VACKCERPKITGYDITGGVYNGKLLNLCMMHKFVHKTFGTMWTIDILVFYFNGSDLER